MGGCTTSFWFVGTQTRAVVSPQTNNYDKKYISYHKKWVVVLPHSGLWGHKPGRLN